MNDKLKSILWHAVPIGLGLLLVACTGTTTAQKDVLVCGQDGSITKRDAWGNLVLIKTNQVCSINQDGSFTVNDPRNEN